LLLNDFLLKEIYGNWFTGKLSDFAGLFVFVIFWISILPKHRKLITWIVAALFVVWKSSYSQPLIDFWNNWGVLKVHRVIDYSDLIALAILPIAYTYCSAEHVDRHFKISPIFPILLSGFAFGATSYDSNVKVETNYAFPYSLDTLIGKLHIVDSLNNGHGLVFSGDKFDTIVIQIPSNFCFSSFDATVVASEKCDSLSSLTLLSIKHNCPKKEGDKNVLSKEFKTKVIDKLK